MTTATEMNNATHLLSEIANGSTLYVSNAMHVWKIDQRCVERFAKAGVSVLKNGNKTGKLLMASGRKFVDIGLCRLELR